MVLDALIAPSILAADSGALRCDCGRILEAGSDWLHIDVMDGHFVPNLSTFDVGMLRSLAPKGTAVLDMHMMVSNPAEWIEVMAKQGADSYTFHHEATTDHEGLIERIHEAGMKAACALKPQTPASALDSFGHALDMILVMTVEPGFGGQKFMKDMMPKVKALRERFPETIIQVDGGVTVDTVEDVAQNGANCIVSGTGVFKAPDPAQAIQTMREAVEKSGYNVRKGTKENEGARRGAAKLS